jgi:hypothetical protein
MNEKRRIERSIRYWAKDAKCRESVSYLDFNGRPCTAEVWRLEAPLRAAKAAGDYKRLYQLRKELKR